MTTRAAANRTTITEAGRRVDEVFGRCGTRRPRRGRRAGVGQQPYCGRDRRWRQGTFVSLRAAAELGLLRLLWWNAVASSRVIPLRRPAWVWWLAVSLTTAYAGALVLLIVSLALGRDPTGVQPIVWYGSAFGLMVASLPVTPSRGSGDRGTHLHQAPRWLKALPFVHVAGLVLAFLLLEADVVDQPETIPLVLATLFGSVGTLMGWYGQFTADSSS